MTGAGWLVKTLKERGVEYVFTLCGNGLNPFYEACLDYGLKVIDVRNEQAAAYMADVWGRMTRRLGVVAVSSGPGHTNAITGLANSFWDGGPMLLISGCSPLKTRGADHFQELDQDRIVAPITKYSALVSRVEALPPTLNTALSYALGNRPGPVHLTIPEDVLSAEIDEKKLSIYVKGGEAKVRARCGGDPDLIREAVELLASARRPFMIVGSGAFYAEAGEEICQFAELTDIPVLTHLWDRGCVNRRIRQYVGVTNLEHLGGLRMLSRADVILAVGARFDYRLSYGRPPVCPEDYRLIRIDVDGEELSRTVIPDIGIQGDPKSVLSAMIEEAKRHRWLNGEWLERVRKAHYGYIERWSDKGWERTVPVPSIRIVRELKRFLDRDVTFLLDGGNIGRWAHLFLFDRHPEHWLTCGISGVVGWGIPGAVAAKLARPDHPVLLLSGDGAAGFTITEIETALRFKTPYVAVIACDNAWGIVADGQPEGRRVASLLGEIRFDRVAEALGARGVYIDDPEKLGPAVEEGLKLDTVTIIHVPTQLGGVPVMAERWGIGTE